MNKDISAVKPPTGTAPSTPAGSAATAKTSRPKTYTKTHAADETVPQYRHPHDIILSQSALGFIGLGLIGGSFALDWGQAFPQVQRVGYDASELHACEALDHGLVDCIDTLENCVRQSSVLLLAVPVDQLVTLLPRVLDLVTERQLVMEAGSVKGPVLAAVAHHPKRHRLLSIHPMAGTEQSGPTAAQLGLFENRIALLVDIEHTTEAVMRGGCALLERIGLKTATLSIKEHDTTAAMLSHLPHLLSYALADTLAQAEQTSDLELKFAGGGLASMMRLSHSPATMWSPIFLQNREPLLAALADYQRALAQLQHAIETNNLTTLNQLLTRHTPQK